MSKIYERRSLSIAPALSADGQTISGRAAVYYDPKDAGSEYTYKMVNPTSAKGDQVEVRERIFPGAFTEAIKSDNVVCAYNHEHNIGRRTAGDPASTMELIDTPSGLEYRTKLPNHMWGQMVKEAIERRDVQGSSFLFVPRPNGVVWRQEGTYLVRELRSLFLFDASPVDQPAYKSTTAELRSEELGEVRSLLETPSPEVTSPAATAPALDRREHDRFETIAGMFNAEARSLSYGQVTSKLGYALEMASGRYIWPEAVYPDHCIYSCGDPPVFYRQEYTIDELENVVLVGEPVKVKPIQTFEPIAS